MHCNRKNGKCAYRASALVITLMFIILLGLEALVVGIILNRSIGTEAVLRGKNLSTKHAASLALNSLTGVIYNRAAAGESISSLWAKYKREGSDTSYSILEANRYTTTNPENGLTDSLPIDTAAWIQEYRGFYVHLVGRAKSDDVDLLTHKWILLTPCTSISTGLTTIATGLPYPGTRSVVVDPLTGRVFFGAINDDAVVLSNMYSWHSSTGLSTLLSSSNYGVGSAATAMASDGRVFFGSSQTQDDGNTAMNDKFWTWKDNILSTILTGMKGGGRWWINSGEFTTFDSRNDRVYFGTAWQSNIYTWKNNQLSTIQVDTGAATDYTPAGGRVVLGDSDEIYFTDNTSGTWKLYRWTPAGPTQMIVDLNALGITGSPWTFASLSDGRIWISEWTGSKRLYTYKTGVGLSTISGSGYAHPAFWEEYPRPGRVHEFANGYAFMTSSTTSYYWNPSSPHVITALGGGQGYSTAINADNTLVAYTDDNTAMNIRVWGPSTGLSTLPGTFDYPGYQEALVWNGNDTLYIGTGNSPGRFFVWNASTQALSTIISSTVSNLGIYGGVKVDSSSGYVYVGSESSTGNFYAYQPTTGLITVLSSVTKPGGYIGMVGLNPLGGVYFGQRSATGNFYYYNPTSNCLTR